MPSRLNNERRVVELKPDKKAHPGAADVEEFSTPIFVICYIIIENCLIS